jgi:CRISPR-associated protein (Cas_Cas02710)
MSTFQASLFSSRELFKMSGISDMTSEWLSLLQNKKDDDALQFYCQSIIPSLLPNLRQKFEKTYGRIPKYNGLVSLLGFTPETVILAYKFLMPEVFVVLHTKETEHLLDIVCKYGNIPLASFYHQPFVEEPSIDIYRALETSLKYFSNGKSRKAIELTGGKKTMGGALSIAAGILDIDLLYIDYESDGYMPQFRKPKPESVYIHFVGNPMRLPIDLFGNIEIENAISFFNIGKYDVSQQLFEQAAQRMANPRLAEIFSSLSEFYMLWNSFDFVSANNLGAKLFSLVLQFHAQMSPKFEFSLNRLKEQIDTVKQLADGDRILLLYNFYFAARRYEKNGQNDIAALLYYRTLESVFDNSLADISDKFNRSKPDYSLFGLSTEMLQSGFCEFRNKAYKNDDSPSIALPKVIAMFDALCLLGALDSPLCKELSPNRVANIAQVRNLSIYAHGIRPITEKSISAIRDLATDAVKAYLEMKQMEPIEKQQDKFEFIELSFQTTNNLVQAAS